MTRLQIPFSADISAEIFKIIKISKIWLTFFKTRYYSSVRQKQRYFQEEFKMNLKEAFR